MLQCKLKNLDVMCKDKSCMCFFNSFRLLSACIRKKLHHTSEVERAVIYILF